MKLTDVNTLNTKRKNAVFCKIVVSIVHRTVAKFHAWEVNIYFVMCFESTFPKRAVKPCPIQRYEIIATSLRNVS